MQIAKEQLKAFLLDSGLVSKKDILLAEKKSDDSKGASIGDVLVKEGKIGEDDFRRLEAYILGIPFVSLEGQKIDFSILSIIPEPLARTHNIVAFKKNTDSLEVA